jgi:RNA polymerase sigma factor (sigma-70 family)
VTGQTAARHRCDGRLAPQSATRSASWPGSRLHRTAGSDAGGTVTAMPGPAVVPEPATAPERAPVPELDVAALDTTGLVRRAAGGDQRAWQRLVDQYARLIWSMTRDFKLMESDAADVAQVTWLRLLEHIDQLEHPARVGSWLAATARHECLRSLAARKRLVLVQDHTALDEVAVYEAELDERLLANERAQDVRKALSRLPWRWQRLLELLMADPPASYAEISDQLGLPVGSIGPTRGRCLARLRVLLQAS